MSDLQKVMMGLMIADSLIAPAVAASRWRSSCASSWTTEKIEGEPLSLEEGQQAGADDPPNLPAAMQGLVVVPIFAGYDARGAWARVEVRGRRRGDEERSTQSTAPADVRARVAEEELAPGWRERTR